MSNKQKELIEVPLGPIGTALLAAALWGVSGTAAQILFQKFAFPTIGLVTIRALTSGLVLFAVFRPKWPKKEAWKLTMLAILGILPSQLFYFIAISYSNIVLALLLEYLFIPMVVVYESFTGEFKFTPLSACMLLLTIFGILLVLLGGGGSLHLSVNPIAVVSGVLSAFGVAYYTLASRQLVKKYNSWEITGWGFLIVGVAMLPGLLTLPQAVAISGAGNLLAVVGLVLVVALLGTLLAYGLEIKALQKLTGSEISVIATSEAIFAAIASFFVFGSQLTSLQYLGGGAMLLAIVILRVLSPDEK